MRQPRKDSAQVDAERGKARITYFTVLDYLDQNWTKKEIVQFTHKTELIIQAIKKNPGIFPYSLKYTNIRRAIVDKNNSFFYVVNEIKREIFILTFFDNR